MHMPPLRHLCFNMRFNVIVTCAMRPDIITTLQDAERITGYPQDAVGGTQVHFDIDIPMRSTSSYDSLMRSVKRASIKQVNEWFGLTEDDMLKISTCGYWRLWEQLSGKNSDVCAANSKVSRDGKFIMPGFYDV